MQPVVNVSVNQLVSRAIVRCNAAFPLLTKRVSICFFTSTFCGFSDLRHLIPVIGRYGRRRRHTERFPFDKWAWYAGE